MKNTDQTITVHAAHLIIGFLHNSLSRAEQKALDKWMDLSTENQELFEELTEGVDDNVFDPDQLIIDTEYAIDLWIIAALIVRRKMKLNNKVEEKYLDDWISADTQNKALFKKLQHPRFMQKMLVWNELKRQEQLA